MLRVCYNNGIFLGNLSFTKGFLVFSDRSVLKIGEVNMDINYVIEKLSSNSEVFRNLFNGISVDQINWRPADNKWCMLEIACHLVDEECEDFRQRVEYTLLKADQQWPAIDPKGWVKSRDYQSRDFNKTVQKFICEREKSIQWLQDLEDVDWGNGYFHPTMGLLSAKLLLFNWLAHDFFHIRQINRYNYEYLNEQTDESLEYAGNW